MPERNIGLRRSKYFDPEILSTLGPLNVVVRQVVEGVRVGMHRSPLRGFSTDFTAHRPYVPGDETRRIDWKLYARARRYYIKLFDAETNFTANLLLDASASMCFASGKISKLEYAKYLAASMAYLIVEQHDSVGVGIFDGELQQYIEPTSSLAVLSRMSHEMEKTRPRPRTDISAILHEFARRMSRRGVVILFSDLFDHTEEFIQGLSHLRFRGHNAIVFHIMDPHELEFPLQGMRRFLGMENEGEMITHSARIRASYLAEVEKFINRIKRACAKMLVDYVLVNTSQPVESVIAAHLIRSAAAGKMARAT
jgi:uncharacterized protein (DUF58 family)